MRQLLIPLVLILISSCSSVEEDNRLKLWYDEPAGHWTEAMPLGNGRLGAVVFGGVEKDQVQFNEETLWDGEPHDYSNKGAVKYLDDIRTSLFEGKQEQATAIGMEHFMSEPLRQKMYQPFGELHLNFPGHKNYTNYYRELDLTKALTRTSYDLDDVSYTREVLVSKPNEIIAIHLKASKAKALDFSFFSRSFHKTRVVVTEGNYQVLNVAPMNSVMRGQAGIKVETDGVISNNNDTIIIRGASEATIRISAATNFVSYKEVTNNAFSKMESYFEKSEGISFEKMKKENILEHQKLFNRFELDFGSNGRDTIPTDERLWMFSESPIDPSLVALYTQFGRYLMISGSRPGTQPLNLQGIWNPDLFPAWGSKYTTNINTEMNYWPAEVTNLSECHEPLFQLIEDCSETGSIVAKEHYGAEGWVLHHNTDIWRGTAPINHSNHGIWLGGSGWISHHLWEHFLFTRDKNFLRDRAYPIMLEAARFYSQFLIPDPDSGWLISTPSNSPENGGLVAGPTMDHQIIRSLYNACIEASEILEDNDKLIEILKDQVDKIAPNQIGQYGQLQEWLTDVDNPENKHRHVSHLWGMHPGNDINWQKSPDMMEAAKKSLLMRGDDGTGWSLSWKINFWARLLEGDHAYELIKLVFRPVSVTGTEFIAGGGSYPNLLGVHPPFQIDGNFGAPAGIVELLIQSHMSTIDILPALPSALPQGSISGVCARGGFELDFSWEDGKLLGLTVLSKAGQTCKLKYADKTIEFETEAATSYNLDSELLLL